MSAEIDWKEKCKDIIFDFANCGRSAEAIPKMQAHLGDRVVIPRAEFTEVRRERSRLRKLLAELSTAQTLHDCESHEEYLVAYNFRIRPLLGLQADGEIGETPTEFGKEIAFDDLLTFCVITFVRDPKRRPVSKCENKECWNYTIAKTKKPRRFCSPKCRLYYHNHRRIDSGESREYKAKKRKEGAKPSYHGPDPSRIDWRKDREYKANEEKENAEPRRDG